MMYLGFDCAAPLTKSAATALYAAGYRFAGRYFSTPACASKCLTAAEAGALGAAGLRVLSVFEVGAADYQGGAEAGARYGAMAKASAQAVAMPETAAIYFAIDSLPADMDKVAAYLAACAAAIAPYRLGIYGCHSVVEAMAARGIGDAYWQCIGWSSGRISRHTNVYQHTGGTPECGVQIDRNICPDMDAAGLWLPEAAEGGDTCPYAAPTGLLAQGSSGEGVKWLQWHLGVAQDGAFGPVTAAALRAFQTAHGLTPDGICGARTRAALETK